MEKMEDTWFFYPVFCFLNKISVICCLCNFYISLKKEKSEVSN